MVTALFLIPASFAQAPGGDKVDLDALAQIKTEAFQHSQVMENLFWMSEVYGPRVTNSRNHKLAAEWAMKQMTEWGLKNVHLEKWPFGYGWQIKHFYAAMETPVYAAFTGFPLAWTPGTNGPITVEPVWAPIHSKADFAKYHGKLKGKALLMFDPAPLTLHTRADAQPSPTDEEILARGASAERVAASGEQQRPALRAVALHSIAIPAGGVARVKASGSTRRHRLPWPMPRMGSCAMRSMPS